MLTALAVALGCGGHATYVDGGDAAAGMDSGASGGGSAENPGMQTGGISHGELPPEVSTYRDPVCDSLPKPAPVFTCDLFGANAASAGCETGMACYPFLVYATDATGCGQEIPGSQCRSVGLIPEGAECGDALGRCEPGHMCVIGNRPGKRCLPLCQLDGPSTCKNGLICVETDVDGIGVCG